jgi:DNA (cytosine-5)-methyltransferase 1
LGYLSLCSGIEAATQAWHPLGWKPIAFSEIEPFACAVLAHHYPTVPNWGDMTKFTEWPDADVDVLVGGTPCQSFSIAGLRAGLADPRGNLMLTYLAIADRYRPEWIVWENVPGVLSSNGGRDFGTFLGGLGQCGYGFAYRVLDAQYVRTRGHPWAVPQRRRRVFVVGYLGDWRRAAAVFIDREGLRGDCPPRRKAGQGVANDVAARPAGGGGLGTDFDLDGGLIAAAAVSATIDASFGRLQGAAGQDASHGHSTLVASYVPPVVPQAMSSKWSKGASAPAGDEVANLIAHAVAPPITHNPYRDHESRDGLLVAHSLIAIQERAVSENPDAGPQGAGFSADGASYTLEARNKVQAVAFRTAGDGAVYEEGDVTAPLTTGTDQNAQIIAQRWRVRRLTPRECERLQGFPDDFTRIPRAKGMWRRVDEAEDLDDLRACGMPLKLKGNEWFVKDPDGPRYKALGNSMAVNVMAFIGERIAEVDAL